MYGADSYNIPDRCPESNDENGIARVDIKIAKGLAVRMGQEGVKVVSANAAKAAMLCEG